MKTISFPREAFGIVLGRGGATIQSIRRQTQTKIQLEEGDDNAHAHISGETEDKCVKAEQMILKIVSVGINTKTLR